MNILNRRLLLKKREAKYDSVALPKVTDMWVHKDDTRYVGPLVSYC